MTERMLQNESSQELLPLTARQQQQLRENLIELTDKMDHKMVSMYLQSKGRLSSSDLSELQTCRSDLLKREKLLHLLLRKDQATFAYFLEALEHCNQWHLRQLFVEQAPAHLPSSATVWTDKLSSISQTLKSFFLLSFKMVNPFSLPFTFDIERSWVSLAIQSHGFEVHKNTITQNHADLITEAFSDTTRFLLVEGKPARGKTTLMRRLAYEWAKGGSKLDCYSLVLYAEFRSLRMKEFPDITDLPIEYMKGFPNQLKDAAVYLKEVLREIYQLNKAHRLNERKRILILLDGFDEAFPKQPCQQLHKFLKTAGPCDILPFDVVLSSRPDDDLAYMKGQRGRSLVAEVMGFTEKAQKIAYINAHFLSTRDSSMVEDKKQVLAKLAKNKELMILAETPLFLTFICLLYKKLETATVFELYRNIIWYLLDRYQTDHPDENVPELFGYQTTAKENHIPSIQRNFLKFPILQKIGIFALFHHEKMEFTQVDMVVYGIEEAASKVGIIQSDFLRADDYSMIKRYIFPHKTIQEFLAGGISYFWPNTTFVNDYLGTFKAIDPIRISDQTLDIDHLMLHVLNYNGTAQMVRFIDESTGVKNTFIEQNLDLFFKQLAHHDSISVQAKSLTERRHAFKYYFKKMCDAYQLNITGNSGGHERKNERNFLTDDLFIDLSPMTRLKEIRIQNVAGAINIRLPEIICLTCIEFNDVQILNIVAWRSIISKLVTAKCNAKIKLLNTNIAVIDKEDNSEKCVFIGRPRKVQDERDERNIQFGMETCVSKLFGYSANPTQQQPSVDMKVNAVWLTDAWNSKYLYDLTNQVFGFTDQLQHLFDRISHHTISFRMQDFQNKLHLQNDLVSEILSLFRLTEIHFCITAGGLDTSFDSGMFYSILSNLQGENIALKWLSIFIGVPHIDLRDIFQQLIKLKSIEILTIYSQTDDLITLLGRKVIITMANQMENLKVLELKTGTGSAYMNSQDERQCLTAGAKFQVYDRILTRKEIEKCKLQSMTKHSTTADYNPDQETNSNSSIPCCSCL